MDVIGRRETEIQLSPPHRTHGKAAQPSTLTGLAYLVCGIRGYRSGFRTRTARTAAAPGLPLAAVDVIAGHSLDARRPCMGSAHPAAGNDHKRPATTRLPTASTHDHGQSVTERLPVALRRPVEPGVAITAVSDHDLPVRRGSRAGLRARAGGPRAGRAPRGGPGPGSQTGWGVRRAGKSDGLGSQTGWGVRRAGKSDGREVRRAGESDGLGSQSDGRGSQTGREVRRPGSQTGWGVRRAGESVRRAGE